MLNWFGESVERIAMLAYALHRIVPTHVARELTIGNFRADFGWADVDPGADPTVGLIEFEDCLPKTLFEQKKRKAAHLGARFLGGFGQLVDWCAFGLAEARSDARISPLLGPHFENASYRYALVAGHRRFANDALSRMRLRWWHDNLKLGHGTSTATFDQVVQRSGQVLSVLERTKRTRTPH